MGIGRSFPEALQKAVGMLNIGASCLTDYPQQIQRPLEEIEFPTDRRLFALYQFFLKGGTVEEAHSLSRITSWFLFHIWAVAQLERQLKKETLTPTSLMLAKKMGFSDRALARLTEQTENAVRQYRIANKVMPYVKQIDTLAGEFAAETNYLYMTYHATEHDIESSAESHYLVLGSGPYAIGSSVEFDWCAVNTLRKKEF